MAPVTILPTFPGLLGGDNCFHCGSNSIDKQLFAAGRGVRIARRSRPAIHAPHPDLFELGSKALCRYGNVFRGL